MAAETKPTFGHFQDLERYKANVAAGRALCDHCDGGGNELYAMYRACPECGGSGIHPEDQHVEDPEPDEPMSPIEPAAGIACVAPTYPAWASTEDGDVVWVRLDLAHRAAEVASAALDWPDSELAAVGPVAMWLDLDQTDWSEGWLLRPVVSTADEAVVYIEYDVGERELPPEDDDD